MPKGRIKYSIYGGVCLSEDIAELSQKGLITMVKHNGDVIVGRYGTNKKTLKKILVDYQKGA